MLRYLRVGTSPHESRLRGHWPCGRKWCSRRIVFRVRGMSKAGLIVSWGG